jgi:hypothetical protein
MRHSMKVVAVLVVSIAATSKLVVAGATTAKTLAQDLVSKTPKQTASGGAADRDKSWTRESAKNAHSSQVQSEFALTSCASFAAEGTGFEPATGFPASDFESDR